MANNRYFLAVLTLLCSFYFIDSARIGSDRRPTFRQPRVIERGRNRNQDPINHFDDDGEVNACNCNWNPRRCGCDCSGEMSDETFYSVSKQLRSCEMFRFKISNARFFALPSNLFANLGRVKEFSLEIYNTVSDHLLDPEPNTSPFRGVSFEDRAFIKLSNVLALRSWNWTPLRELESVYGKGMDIEIDGFGLRKLSSDFSNIASGSVKSIKISSSNLEMVGGGSFASFNNISRLILPNNRIRALTRSILPEKALKLEEIDLRQNSLSTLEPDMFIAMPSLKKLSLKGNPLRVIGEETFRPILKNTNIDGLSSLPLVCDCRVKWLTTMTSRDNLKVKENLKGAICKRPPHLRGTPLRDLAPEHLICR